MFKKKINVSLQGWKAREYHLLIFKIVKGKILKMELKRKPT